MLIFGLVFKSAAWAGFGECCVPGCVFGSVGLCYVCFVFWVLLCWIVVASIWVFVLYCWLYFGFDSRFYSLPLDFCGRGGCWLLL